MTTPIDRIALREHIDASRRLMREQEALLDLMEGLAFPSEEELERAREEREKVTPNRSYEEAGWVSSSDREKSDHKPE